MTSLNSSPSAVVPVTCASKSRGCPKVCVPGSRSLKSAVIFVTVMPKGARSDSSTSGPGAKVS